MSMDLRRRARPGRKTGDIPPDRTETRSEARPKLEVDAVRPYRNPKPETRSVLRRLTPFGVGHRPNRRTNQKPPQADSIAGARLLKFRHANRQSACRPASQPALLGLVGVSNKQTAVTGKFRRIKPEFAFAGSMTRGPVSRHATTSRLAEPVFGRRQVGAVSSETFDWPAGSGNTQAIARHHFTPGDVYPRRTTATGSARQRDIDNNTFVLTFSCSVDNSTAHIAYGDRLEYSCSNDDDACSSVDA